MEPWAHEDDTLQIGTPVELDPQPTKARTLDFKPRFDHNEITEQPSKSNRKYYVDANKKSGTINFVRKNLEDVKSQAIIPADYASLLSEDYDNFFPINPCSTVSSISRRPTIKTTCIGYYD